MEYLFIVFYCMCDSFALVAICRYECIESDLLGSLKHTVHEIAPYKSKGVEKASLLN